MKIPSSMVALARGTHRRHAHQGPTKYYVLHGSTTNEILRDPTGCLLFRTKRCIQTTWAPTHWSRVMTSRRHGHRHLPNRSNGHLHEEAGKGTRDESTPGVGANIATRGATRGMVKVRGWRKVQQKKDDRSRTSTLKTNPRRDHISHVVFDNPQYMNL